MITLTVEKQFDNLRVDQWLKKIFPNIPYSQLMKLIRKRKVSCCKIKLSLDSTIKEGKEINIHNPPSFILEPQKNDDIYNKEHDEYFQKLIVFENKYFLAINKPRGLAVQGGTKTPFHLDKIKKSYEISKKTTLYRVHRIDKETTGLILIAKNREFAKHLSSLFHEKKIIKNYIALVDGIILKKQGSWTQDLIHNKKNEKAITKYKLIKKFDQSSLLLLSPITGRKHQLRRHCYLNNHPIIGDQKYNKQPKHKTLLLHAWKYYFEKYNITANLPSDFCDESNICLNLENYHENLKK